VPIYDRSYRAYDGELCSGLAWWVIVQQELRVLFATRSFIILLCLAGTHFAIRLMQVVACDVIAANPASPFAELARRFPLTVNENLFFQFLTGQSTLLFWILLFAGSGMICNDIHNNLMEVYFSKPITWRDYALGKIMTLVLVGLLLTAVPGVVLVFLHNLLAPGWETLRTSYLWPFTIVAFSLIIVVPCSLAVLAGSAILKNQRTAAIVVLVLVFFNLGAAEAVSDELFKDDRYNLIGIPLAIFHLGSLLFHQGKPLYDLPWWTSALVVAGASAVVLGIICHKVHRCEVEA
jgi:ABC-type transport system involved in multi-copper enzyme maturation permease subunit